MRMRCTGSSGPWADGRPAPQVPHLDGTPPAGVGDQPEISSQPILPSTSSIDRPDRPVAVDDPVGRHRGRGPGLRGRDAATSRSSARDAFGSPPSRAADHRQRHVEPTTASGIASAARMPSRWRSLADGPRQHERPDARPPGSLPHRRQVGEADPRVLVLVPVDGRPEPAQPVEVDRRRPGRRGIEPVGELDRGRSTCRCRRRPTAGRRGRPAGSAPGAACRAPAGVLDARPGAPFAGEHARRLDRRRALRRRSGAAAGRGSRCGRTRRAGRAARAAARAGAPRRRPSPGAPAGPPSAPAGGRGTAARRRRPRPMPASAVGRRGSRRGPRPSARALAGRARGRSGGVGDPAGPAPALRRRSPPRARAGAARASPAAGSRHPSAARPPPVRVEDRRGVRRAEPPRRVERLAERDVVDALGEDRLEVGGLGALRARGTAGSRAARTRRRGGRRRPVRTGSRDPWCAAHRAIVRVDDGTGWVWDLPVMSPVRLARAMTAAATASPCPTGPVAEPCPLRRAPPPSSPPSCSPSASRPCRSTPARRRRS